MCSSDLAIKAVLATGDDTRLFRWVAILTGSKNALKGVGFFLGGVLLAAFGFTLNVLTLMALSLAIGLLIDDAVVAKCDALDGLKDGIIDKIFIEPDKEGDPFEVSDADTMLRHINPAAKPIEPVVMFSKPGCPFCARAKAVLKARGIAFTDIPQDQKITTSVLRAVSGEMTWPQVFVGGTRIGGADAVEAHFGQAAAPDGAQAA